MELQRLKSIDIFRGLCMSWMILTHLIDWWLKNEYNWLHSLMIMILDPIGASGFLFISGVSISLSLRKRIIKANSSEDYNNRIIRNSYLFRALFVVIIALIYNSTIAIRLFDPSMIWAWFILLTSGVSLFLGWPLLKLSKWYRIIVGLIILIFNQIIFALLLPFEGDSNIHGLLFHIFYHPKNQDPILTFFPFFLFGTVIGDSLFDTILSNNENNGNRAFKNKFLIPTLIIGTILIIVGILFRYPTFLKRESFSWIIYSLGIEIVLISILLIFDIFNIVKTKKSYKLLFYYSYYSLTIYLAHNLLYFLFLEQLNAVNIWFFAAGAFISIGLILRVIYKIWGAKASIKVQIGRLSYGIAIRIEQKLQRKILIINEGKS
ncbi:MAG: heparan-alpha-glucosaminide N-acetyltransferase domain-containing protein [Promethearchaeota archaeon]